MSNDDYQQQFEIIEIDKNGNDPKHNELINDFDTGLVQIVYSSDECDSEDDYSDNEMRTESSATSSFKKQFNCCYCDISTPVKTKFGEHMQNAHGFSIRPAEFFCRTCTKHFNALANFRRHNSNVHQKRNKIYRCPFCELQIKSKTSARKHVSEHVEVAYHPCKSNELGYNCRYCHQMFWTIPKLNEHTLNWHAENCSDNFLLCNFCLATFVNKTSLRLHYAFQHPNLQQFDSYVFQCKICRIAYATLDRIRTHMNENHPQYKSVYCSRPQCRFNIGVESALDEHVKSAHTIHMFRCLACSKHLKTKNNAIRHFEWSHRETQMLEQ